MAEGGMGEMADRGLAPIGHSGERGMGEMAERGLAPIGHNPNRPRAPRVDRQKNALPLVGVTGRLLVGARNAYAASATSASALAPV